MLIWLALCKALTILTFNQARLIRYPLFLRVAGDLRGGIDLTTGWCNRIDVFSFGVLTLGDRVQINDNCHIACAESVSIGNDCLIASRVFITDHDHRLPDVGISPNSGSLTCAPVSIGDRVWIGEGVAILKGVAIGNDVVIGANSVVTKDIPDGAIVAGIPARVIRFRVFPVPDKSKN